MEKRVVILNHGPHESGFTLGSVKFVMGVLEIVYPKRCLLCGESLIPGCSLPYSLCNSCSTALPEIGDAENRCAICSRPLLSEKHVCMSCRERDYPFTNNKSVYYYRDEMKELIYRYKFKFKKDLACFFAIKLYVLYKTSFRAIPLIPVPASRETVRKRGFDHIKRITSIMEKTYGISTRSLLLKKKTPPQKSLDPVTRLTNLQGKIEIKQIRKPLPKAAVLVDDVFTTGATLSTCASVLIEAGIPEIFCLTLALD